MNVIEFADHSSASRAADEYSLLDYVDILRRRFIWLLIPVAATVALACFFSVMQADRFEAESQVLLSGSAAQRTLDPGSQNTGFLSREMTNEISLARSDVVTQGVEARLAEEEVDISISASDQADILIFEAEAPNPLRAVEIANVWAETYVAVKQDEAMASVQTATTRLGIRLEELRAERQRLRQPLDELQDRIQAVTGEEEDAEAQRAQLQAQYDRLASDLGYELSLLTSQSQATVASMADLELQAEVAAVGEARIIQVAAPPVERANAPLARNLALGIVLGLMVGTALALFVDMRDTTLKTQADVQAMGLSVLAAVPEAPQSLQKSLARITQADPESIYADAYQKLRAAVDFMAISGGTKTVLITSPNAAEGKSTTASNLAVAISSVGRSVALVDVDFRRSRVHKIYKIEKSPGLSDHITGREELGQIARRVNGASGLYLIPTGMAPPNPAAFVGLPSFAAALRAVATQVETVILDAPPLLAVSDTYSMASQVDGVVLAVRAGSTTRAELTEALTALAQLEANVLGVVMIGVDESDSYGGRYYTQTDTGRVPAVSRPQTNDGALHGNRASPEIMVLEGHSTHPGAPNRAVPSGSQAQTGPRPMVNVRRPSPGQPEPAELMATHRQPVNGSYATYGAGPGGYGANGQPPGGQVQDGHQVDGYRVPARPENGHQVNGHQAVGANGQEVDTNLGQIFPEMFER